MPLHQQVSKILFLTGNQICLKSVKVRSYINLNYIITLIFYYNAETGKVEEKPPSQQPHGNYQEMTPTLSQMPSMPPPPMPPPQLAASSMQSDNSNTHNGDKREQKRKSRWDDS